MRFGDDAAAGVYVYKGPQVATTFIRPTPEILAVVNQALPTATSAMLDSGPVQVIPPSDPRHPQFKVWQAQQLEAGSFLTKYGLYLGLGGAAVVLGAAWFLTE